MAEPGEAAARTPAAGHPSDLGTADGHAPDGHAPDLGDQPGPPEALRAWRYWQLTPGRRLRSVSQRRFVWPPGEVMRAVCVGGGHAPPVSGCNCGLYGAVDLEALRAQRLCVDADPLVVGQVALWGRMVSDDAGGYRARYASPRTLSLVSDTALEEAHPEILAALRAYGVPVGTARLDEVVDEVSASAIAYEAMARAAAGR